MTIFVATQDGPVNDGSTFNKTSPGVAGTDYPDPTGGDTVDIEAGYEITVPSGTFSISVEMRNGPSAANKSKLILSDGAILDMESDIWIRDNCEVVASGGATINLNGFDLAQTVPVSGETWISYLSLEGTSTNPNTVNCGTGGITRRNDNSRSTQHAKIVTTAGGATGIQQNILTIGQTYRTRGYCRGDGTVVPTITLPGEEVVFNGTSSINPQYFDETFTADLTGVFFIGTNAGGAGNGVRFDDVTVENITDPGVNILVDGDFQAVGFASWTAVNAPTLTKEASYLGGGLGDATTVFDMSYCDINSMGSSELQIDDSADSTIQYCNFATCDGLEFSALTSTSDFIFTRNDFSSPSITAGYVLKLDDSATPNTGTRTISYNTFTDTAAQEIHAYAHDLDFTGNVLNNHVIESTAGRYDHSYTANTFAHQIAQTQSLLTLTGGGTITQNVFVTASDDPTCITTGADATSDTLITYNTFELTYDVASTTPGRAITANTSNLEIKNNLLVSPDQGVLLSSVTAANSCDVDLSRNTVYVAATGGTLGNLMATESGGTYTGTAVSVRNNLVLEDGRGINIVGAADQITYTDYNAFDTADDYNGVAIAGKVEGDPGFGGSDQTSVVPDFVDNTASISTWDTSIGGAGTLANAVTELLLLNDSSYDSRYSTANARLYYAAGFAPQNEDLESAGDPLDSNPDIGAFSVVGYATQAGLIYQSAGNVRACKNTYGTQIDFGSIVKIKASPSVRGEITISTAANDAHYGVAPYDIADEAYGDIIIRGQAKILCAEYIQAGDRVTADSNGQGVVAVSGNGFIGVATESAPVGSYVSVELIGPGGAEMP